MITTRSGLRTSNQQEISVLISYLLLSTSSQGQSQEIVTELVDRLQDPYLEMIYISTSEHLKIYKKESFGLPESDRYDLTRSKWNEFYQELDDAVSKF